MQDWDRFLMLGVGVGVSLYTGYEARKLWRKSKYLGVFGLALLIVGAIAVPALLAIMGS